MSSLIIDIETEPLPDSELLELFEEPELPPPPGEFDPDSVKLGNIKAQDKIQAKIEEARQKHEAEAGGYDKKCSDLRNDKWREFLGKAALSESTGRICVVGLMDVAGQHQFLEGSEYDILANTLREIEKCLVNRGSVIGFYSNTFDIPFIARRAWLHDLELPRGMMALPYLPAAFVDLHQVWQFGDRTAKSGGLDAVAKYLGCTRKLEGMDGADFAAFYRGGGKEREQALEYLLHDLRATREIANKMGIL